MTDIARLGFSADTDELTIAEQKLKKLVPAAKGAEQAAETLGNSLKDVGASSTGAKRGVDSFTASTVNSSAAVKKLAADNDNLSRSQRVMGQTAGQLQSNISNLGAQFQDIGVTASMGMNPLLIGMQQGSQIAMVMNDAIGKQGLMGGLKQLGTSFLSVLGPVTFLTIAFTAGLAALIQWVDWADLAKSALGLLADNFEMVAKVAVIAGATMLVAFGPQIIASIVTLTTSIAVGLVGAIWSVTKAMVAFSLANPFTAFILAIAVVLTAVYVFRDEMAKIFGFDIIKVIKDAADSTARFMIAAYRTIVRVWDDLPNIAHDMVQRVKKELNGMVQIKGPGGKVIWSMFEFDVEKERGALANVVNVFREEMDKIKDYSFTDAVGKGFDKFVKGGVETVRNLADSIGAGGTGKDGKSKAGGTGKDGKPDDMIDVFNEKYGTAKMHKTDPDYWMRDIFKNAKKDAIDLSEVLKDNLGSAMKSAEAALDEWRQKFKESADFARGVFKGVFADFKSNLTEGQNIFQAFANSILNAVNRVLDRVLDKTLDGIFDSIFGGIDFSTIFNGGKLFAKGGAFSNSVVSGPTAFMFAKGGSNLGIMGEAGPEAVMPLSRGPDGSLGVQMYGNSGGGGRNVVELRITGEEGPMFRPTIEAISENKAVQVTQAGISAYNDQLPDRVQQIANDDRMR